MVSAGTNVMKKSLSVEATISCNMVLGDGGRWNGSGSISVGMTLDDAAVESDEVVYLESCRRLARSIMLLVGLRGGGMEVFGVLLSQVWLYNSILRD